jgi:hypothetical protein
MPRVTIDNSNSTGREVARSKLSEMNYGGIMGKFSNGIWIEAHSRTGHYTMYIDREEMDQIVKMYLERSNDTT